MDAKVKLGSGDALALARGVAIVVVAKGRNVVRFDMENNAPNDETLLAHLLGPTGNLRAPTLKKGTTLVVGFNEDVYEEFLARK